MQDRTVETLRVLTNPQGKILLICGLVAFESILVLLAVLILNNKATMEDMKGILGACLGFFLGWLSPSPMAARLQVSTSPTQPTTIN